MKREKFGSRLGFILVSAGCAIGIGNVWKFPYLCGQFGGAAFILIYLIFLLILGIPVMMCEFSAGRASQRSIARAFDELEPDGSRFHMTKWFGVIGCYLLMMFYTTVAGWMTNYCFKSVKGDFKGLNADQVGTEFNNMLGSAPQMAFWTILICIIGFTICYFGFQNSVERITKFMMGALLVIMVALAVHSVFLEGAGEGIRFYLVPNFNKMIEMGIGNVIFAAMSQAFFTLSIGIGSMLIFGSYIDKERKLFGETISITALDTFVALMAGFIIIPACFAYGVEPGSGPPLIFITIPNIFAQMPGGQILLALFFLFLTFAALTTVVAVFENLVAGLCDLLDWDRKKSVLVNAVLVTILSMPCVLGYNVWSGIQLIGPGSTVLDFEDFIVSNNLLPLGSLVLVLFCTRKNGWGWDNFLAEANAGKGKTFPAALRGYMTYVLPVIIGAVYLKGYYDFFAPKGTTYLVGWMCVAIVLLGFTLYCTLTSTKKK